MSQEEHPTEQTPAVPEKPVDEPAHADAQTTATPEQPQPAESTAEPTTEPAVESAPESVAEVAEATPVEDKPAEAVSEGDGEPAEQPSEDAKDAESTQSKAKPSSEASSQKRRGKRGQGKRGPQGPDVKAELERLYELATKYPEVGAPLAKLAIKLGHQSIGERLIKMKLDSEIEARGVEFYRVSAELARKEGRSHDVFTHVLEGIEGVLGRGQDVAQDERDRLLHLIRLGFVVLLFDLEDLKSAPEFTAVLIEKVPMLESSYGDDPFYHTLRAQAFWFEEVEKSEAAWERAVALRDAETTWNSRGTWYKEADKDFARAEWAYRSGLRALPTSTLLRHNLAQVLMDRVQNEGGELSQIRSWLGESEALLRQALRHARRHGMRRHINGNIERVKALQADLPKVEEVIEPPPEVGAVVRGRVRSFKNYGVFLALGRHYSGLLHISEIAHERVQDPADVLKMGDMIEVKVLSVEARDEGDGLRIALSRKAILPVPEGGVQSSGDARPAADKGDRPRQDQQRRARGGRGGRNQGGGGGQNRSSNRSRSDRSDRPDRSASSQHSKKDPKQMGSLGEMLLAKLEEKQNK